jgi:hypothetical protein
LSEATAVPDPIEQRIAQYLSGAFLELASGRSYSQILNMDLSKADARGCATRLVILQCDSDDLQLVSIIRKHWLVDYQGIRNEIWPWSFPRGLMPEDFQINPYIRFATDGVRLRIGAAFGPAWYWVKFGFIPSDEAIATDAFADEFIAIPGQPIKR